MKKIYTIMTEGCFQQDFDEPSTWATVLGHFSTLEKAQECLVNEKDKFISDVKSGVILYGEDIDEDDEFKEDDDLSITVSGSVKENFFRVTCESPLYEYTTEETIKLISKDLED